MPIDRPPAPADLRASVILVIDDEEVNVRLLSRILGRAGFEHVHTTTDSRDAMGLFDRLSPDLILLDIHMPVMDGFAVLAALRSRVPATDDVPVLAITGDDSSDTRQRVLIAGARDFLGKPFQSSEVVVRVENLLTTRMLHRSLRAQNEALEETVRERTAELQAALAAAESASRAKSQFLATMSHELRTPLNAVIGFSQHLLRNRKGTMGEQDTAYLERIRDNGGHLLGVITDILELSRIQTGDVQMQPAPVELGRLVADVAAQVRPLAAPGVDVRLECPTPLATIVTDDDKLRHMLLHLGRNAVKFTSRGHLTFGVVADGGTPVRVDVVDTGIGIPPDRLSAIFGSFEQADNTTQRQFSGAGLGLAISRTMGELLGFRLAAVSELGVGSAFSVLLVPSASAPTSYADVASFYASAAPVSG